MTAKRRRDLAAMAAVLAIGAAAPLASGGARSTADTGTLALRAVFGMDSRRGDYCPPGTSGSIECFLSNGHGAIPGLGKVSESYLYRVEVSPPECAAGSYRALDSEAHFTVLGKGAIELAIAGTTECLSIDNLLKASRPFTVTGGSRTYADASGSGTLQHAATNTANGAAGTDTWVGTLVVPGFDFDVTAPILTGAVGKTVRAPRGVKGVRVTYRVTARDDVDGALPVSCRPGSGTRFRPGTTVVSCSATDTSENTRTAKFRVTVKAAR